MDIETQQKKTQAASDELKEASNSYEITPFNGMSKEETAVLERMVDKRTIEYQKEKVLKRKDGVCRLIFSGSYI